MSNPRNWSPSDDERPPAEWTRRSHEWSWGGDHQSHMRPTERVMRTVIKWSWVVAFVVILIAYLTR